jgi:hypothetical protein
MTQTVTFRDVLDAADQLSLDEQCELISILNRRLKEAARERLIADEFRQEPAAQRRQPTSIAKMTRSNLN